jgi:hypothetical protein
VDGTGGSICHGLIFRRSWFHVNLPAVWVGKALCVRMPWQAEINTCQSLQPECNCLPYLKKMWKGNVWLAAEGYRYNIQMDLLPHEKADIEKWQHTIHDAYPLEEFYMSMRFLQWDVADVFSRPLFWTSNNGNKEPSIPSNYILNETACSRVGCGQVQGISNWPYTDSDTQAVWFNGSGSPGDVSLPAGFSSDYCPSHCHRTWTVQQDSDGTGALWTGAFRGEKNVGGPARHRAYTWEVEVCPRAGCWPKPPPPPAPPPEDFFSRWSHASTWQNLTSHYANPLNDLETVEVVRNQFEYSLLSTQQWSGEIPGEYDNVWCVLSFLFLRHLYLLIEL